MIRSCRLQFFIVLDIYIWINHTFALSADALNQACSLDKYVSDPLRGAIMQARGLALAFVAQTNVDRSVSEHVLAQASKLVDTKEHDHYHVRFNRGRYLLELGDAQIVLNRPGQALDTLDEADNIIGLDQQRRKAYISILRADSLTTMKCWDMATDQLSRAVELSSPINSTYNMDYMSRLSIRIQASPYAQAFPTVQLRMSLQKYQLSHQL